VDLSDRICRLVANIAAKPARLRNDGELFREDLRRLGEICSEEDDPSLNACLWAAQGVGWVARVDNELRATDVEALIDKDRVSRHRELCDWLFSRSGEGGSRRKLAELLDELGVGQWHSVMDFIEYVRQVSEENEEPSLRSAGGHWHYVAPGASATSERGLARSLEETMLWTGVVDRSEADGESVFRITELGRSILLGEAEAKTKGLFPTRKSELVVQPNFDIVVDMKEADPLLTAPLDQFCDRVSASQVAVYHLTKDSFTRAIQQGRDGSAFIEFLMEHNKGGELPRNVMTTLEDWRGGMKRVRVRTVQILEADDPLVMADIRHRKRFAKHIDSVNGEQMVVLKKTRKSELKKVLEKEGFVVE
jgi:hypothetical protein